MFLSMFQILDKSQPKRTNSKTSVWQEWIRITEQQFNAKLFAARKIAEHYSEFKDFRKSYVLFLVYLLLL
jgi:hypothetical protein